MSYYTSKLKELGQTISVLYVEDEIIIQQEVKLMLGKFFNQIVCASNGQEGLELYKANTYDIVITDIAMPLMDGLDMAENIKQINRDQIIIVVTAFTDTNYFTQAVKIGISGFILKPVQINQFIDTVYDAAIRVYESKQNHTYRNSLETLVKEKTDELLTSYTTDHLTGLPNYYKLKDALSSKHNTTVILLNIDNFDTINDFFGVEVGDEMLLKVSEPLKILVQLNDATLYRTHGDEFVILMDGDTKSGYELALSIRAFFSETKLVLRSGDRVISFMIGIDSGNALETLNNAKIAIREVRSLGKNHIQIYSEDTQYSKEQKSRLLWIERSREAIANDLFLPYFQPIQDNKTLRIVKYEALARMRFEGEIIPPEKFIEPARLAGILPAITRIILDKSFAYFATHEGHFSVNIGDYDIKEGYLITFLAQKLAHYRIDPSRITLEVLETISMQDTKESILQLNALKSMGLGLSIDDFGTESSNFSRLLELNVDYIKIDGCFIKNLNHDENSQKITASIVAFAHTIGAKVIAEFVHNEAVYEKVRAFGIEYSQGYFIGQPNESTEVKK